MTAIKLRLPEEVLREVQLPYEGVRDLDAIVLAIDGVNVAASLVTLATLRPHLRALASAIRRWRLRQLKPSVVLTVDGPGIAIKIDLPPNVSTGQILRQLEPLFDDE